MKLSQVRHLALRLTVPQNVSNNKNQIDKLVFPTAFLLATFGVSISTFSLKQMINAPKNN